MKRFYIVLILSVMILGCKRQQDQPPMEGQTDEQLAGKVDTLIAAIENGDITAVVAAADAVETIGPKGAKAAPALASKLDDPQPWVRMACMHALQAIGEPAVPSLLEAFQTGPGGAPVRAVNVLGNIGPPAKAVVPELRKALQERPESLHSWIEGALAKIEGIGTQDIAEGGPQQSEKVVLPAESPLTADNQDWPQFHGPNRDNMCRETGLNMDWAKNLSALLWQIEGLGMGYSSISIVDGKIFTMGDRKGTDGNTAQFVIAFDLKTRKELWATKVGPGHKDGPRSTPTNDGELLYSIGTEGDIVCLETAGGKERWRKSLPNDFDGQMMSGWKFSESPLSLLKSTVSASTFN